MSLINWAELQLGVMDVLWKRGEATVHEVIADLSTDDHVPAYTTILTVLTNLAKQGLVTHEARSGKRMFAYRALAARSEIQEGITNELLDRLFDGSPTQLVLRLLETHSFEETELQEIWQVICTRQTEDFELKLE